MTDHLHALAMRTKAAEVASRIAAPIGCAAVPFRCANAILALPLEADHAELLAEAVKLPEIAAMVKFMGDFIAICNALPGAQIEQVLGRQASEILLALATP